MNCKFCQSPLWPINSVTGVSSYNHGTWLCTSCPCPVKYDGPKLERFSIMCYYKNHWYDFQYMPQFKTFLLYCIDYYLIPLPGGTPDEADHKVNKILMKDVPPLENITPQNASTKIITILTFS